MQILEKYRQQLNQMAEMMLVAAAEQQVAEYLGTSQTMVARYEREASELPLRHFIRLCQLYKVSADEVLGLRRRN